MRLAVAAAALHLIAIGNDTDRLAAHADRIDVAAPNWFAVSRRGAVSGTPDPRYARVAAAHGTAVWPVVNARLGFRGGWLRNRPVAVARQIARVTRPFDGVTLDIEEIRPGMRRAYTRFVATVQRAVPRVAVYAVRRTSALPSRSAAAYDHHRLARVADLVLASGYGEHSPSGVPGPLTTRAGFLDVLEYARKSSPTRVAPVLGGFGIAWPLSGDGPGRVVSTAGLPANTDHAIRDGDVLWYGTGAALRAQRAAARRAGFRWIALFSLGREPAGFWDRGATASRATRPDSLPR